MATLSEVENVCSFLASKGITISPTNKWLSSCIEWFKTENSSHNIRQVQEFAHHQLLLADLCAVAEACLPPTVSEARTSKLLGKYFVQINSAIDVGKSAYSQFQSLRKHSLANLEVTEEKQELWTPLPNRMLKLEITDGIRVVFGMEYSQIKKLSVNIVPGTKILIKGPVECRSGVIMLQDNNIVVLGGEVDSLFDSNHYNRIITKTLNIDENLLPVDETCVVSPPQQSVLSSDNKCSNSLQTMTQLSSLSSTSTGFSSENPCTLSNNNLGNMYQRQLLDENVDYFADSDVFLNVANIEESVCAKKKLIEVNASVAAFKSKLIIKDNNWNVTVRLNTEEEGSMKASFDPDLLDRLIGFSPGELNSKESHIVVNPAMKEKMNCMLKRGQQVIKNLKCHMTLVHEQGSELPVIIAISDDDAFYDPEK